MIRKSKLALYVILFAVLLVLDVFALTGLGRIAQYLSIIMATIGFGVFFIYRKSFPKTITKFTWGLLAIFVLSIFSANQIHHQSIFSGIIASSQIYFIGTTLICYYLIIKYGIDYSRVRKLLLISGWIALISYLYIFLSGTLFYSSDGESIFGVEYLRKGLIIVASLIYLGDFFTKNRYKYLVFSILLFSAHHLGDFQRFVMFEYLACFIVLTLYFSKQKVMTKSTIAYFLLIPTLIIFLTTTNLGSFVSNKISDVLEVFNFEQEEYSEYSVEARFIQSEVAINSIKQYPITGIGRIKSSDIYKITGQKYFHITDIGVIGILYSYGIFGIILLIYQASYVFVQFTKRRIFENPELLGIKVFLVFIGVHAIISGRTLHMPGEFMLAVVILEAGKLQYRQRQLQLKENSTKEQD